MTVVSTENTLRKLGAHLRWLIEKCGVDAEEGATVAIIVQTAAQRDKIVRGLLVDFDPGSMERLAPDKIKVHGVRVAVVLEKETA